MGGFRNWLSQYIGFMPRQRERQDDEQQAESKGDEHLEALQASMLGFDFEKGVNEGPSGFLMLLEEAMASPGEVGAQLGWLRHWRGLGDHAGHMFDVMGFQFSDEGAAAAFVDIERSTALSDTTATIFEVSQLAKAVGWSQIGRGVMYDGRDAYAQFIVAAVGRRAYALSYSAPAPTRPDRVLPFALAQQRKATSEYG